jgi:Plasmid pRiA4b ORF-3-like protein
MTDLPPAVAVYQLHASLLEISPAIWRRLLVRSDTTIADLHYILQIAFDWTDSHLHRFVIYGKDYGIAQLGGIGFADNPHQLRLCDLRLRINGRFRYEYDFGDLWQHQLRLERILPLEHTGRYPSCTGGARAAPPEDCGGPWAFLALKQHYTPRWLAHQLLAILQNEPDELDVDDLAGMDYWLQVDRFDRRTVNRRLQAYAPGDEPWRDA